MNSIGPNHPLILETNYRIHEIQHEAKLASLRKQAYQIDAQPTLFKRLTVSLAALLQTSRVQPDVMMIDEPISQPVMKRATATFSKV